MSMWHKVVITVAVLAFVGGALGLARLAVGSEVTNSAALTTYLFLAFPLFAWWLARQLAPVRVSDFDPPKLWLRIRNPEFARAFRQANPTVSVVGND